MTETIIIIVVWNTCTMIVYFAIIDKNLNPLRKIGYILFSWAFAFLFAPFEIAKAINKINNSKTKDNESRQGNKID